MVLDELQLHPRPSFRTILTRASVKHCMPPVVTILGTLLMKSYYALAEKKSTYQSLARTAGRPISHNVDGRTWYRTKCPQGPPPRSCIVSPP